MDKRARGTTGDNWGEAHTASGQLLRGEGAARAQAGAQLLAVAA